MSRVANVVLLCEDRQHEAFARRFLRRRGYSNRNLRVRIAPPGRGSAEQFVRESYPEELQHYRSRQHRVSQLLVVVIDADTSDRQTQLAQSLEAAGLAERSETERVAVFTPARNIETWLAYLDGQDVNEEDRYPRLQRQRDCQEHVDRLISMCDTQQLREPAPASLALACDEYRRRVAVP